MKTAQEVMAEKIREITDYHGCATGYCLHEKFYECVETLLEASWLECKKSDPEVQKLVGLYHEIIPALEATGVNVSLAADARKALKSWKEG